MTTVWAGVDAGKSAHHCVVIDADGNRLLSRRIVNAQNEIDELVDVLLALGEGGDVVWATDLNSGGAALLLAVLCAREQSVFYIPGRVVHYASVGYRGEAKTDAKDAAVIADQARVRRDLQPLELDDDTAVTLRLLTGFRTDRMRDRVRTLNRLRAVCSEFFPTLERALDVANAKGTLVLLTGYPSAGAIRQLGHRRLAEWLRNRGVYNSDKVARVAVDAAHSQSISVPGEEAAATLIGELARQALALHDELAELDKRIATVFRNHRYAAIIESMPGMGPVLGAEFIAATGGDMKAIGSADRLAAMAGLAPVARDSGRISGNHRRPRRFDRRLLRVFFISSQLAARSAPESREYYQRKRNQGKRHTQAVLALGRRRVNVLFAMLRDHRHYQPTTPALSAPAA